MIERTEQRLDLKPDWLTADTAYGTGRWRSRCSSRHGAPPRTSTMEMISISPVDLADAQRIDADAPSE
jgi:hypothetical protein